jgi:hypothetical protein
MEDISKIRQNFIEGLSMIPSMIPSRMVLEDIETTIHEVLMFTLDGKGNSTLTCTTLAFNQMNVDSCVLSILVSFLGQILNEPSTLTSL